MHMSDALLSLPVAGAFWAVSGTALVVSTRHLAKDSDSSRAPRMGVLAAFVFAAQMINFALPGTGSSGHIAGAVLLSLLLGPWAAFVALTSVLTVQALFFGDGGILALGANIFNMGFLACFLVIPLIYRPLVLGQVSQTRKRLAVMVAAVAAATLGALCVTLQTTASGLSQLPFRNFALIMIPVHLAIGLVEGFISILILEQVGVFHAEVKLGATWNRKTFATVGLATLLVAGGLSRFASIKPDGLNFSVEKMGANLVNAPGSLNAKLSAWQGGAAIHSGPGSGLAGLLGAGIVFFIALLISWIFRSKKNNSL